MKLILKYLTIAIVLVAFMGCERDDIDIPSNDRPIIEGEGAEYGYIFFDSESTRGTLIEPEKDANGYIIDNRLKQDFAVIGYTYIASEWSYAEAMTKPNVFDKHPQPVIWYEDETIHKYEPEKAWIGKQNYSFFAYTPIANNITPSGSGEYGNPYIDFTFQRNNLAAHQDIMTADNIHIDYTAHSVGFSMQHRLTAIDVTANNLYSGGKELKITSMKITLNNLLYDKVRIPLNTSDKIAMTYPYGMASTKEATYNLLTNGSTLTVAPGAINALLTPQSEKTTMIVIPQEQYIDTDRDGTPEDYTLTGKVNVAYQIWKNGTQTGSVTAKDYPFSFDRSLTTGQRYYVQLNFAEGDVTVGIIQADSWEEYPNDVDHNFE